MTCNQDNVSEEFLSLKSNVKCQAFLCTLLESLPQGGVEMGLRGEQPMRACKAWTGHLTAPGYQSPTTLPEQLRRCEGRRDGVGRSRFKDTKKA